MTFQIIGRPAFPKGREPFVQHRVATPGYFKAIGTDLRRGRLFNDRDDARGQRVLLINEMMARMFFPGQEPVGQRLKFDALPDETLEIIGVVADVKNDDLEERADPAVYAPYAQRPWPMMNLIVRANQAPALLASAVRGQVRALDRNALVSRVKPLRQMIDERASPKRMLTWMIGIFAAVAVALAGVGMYAVISYSVAQRAHEIGLRMALGALPRDIMKLVIRRGLKLTLIGMVIGLAGAFAMTRAMSFFLYGVTATDPPTFIGVSLLLAGVALLACWIPARRATNVDPMIALRSE